MANCIYQLAPADLPSEDCKTRAGNSATVVQSSGGLIALVQPRESLVRCSLAFEHRCHKILYTVDCRI